MAIGIGETLEEFRRRKQREGLSPEEQLIQEQVDTDTYVPPTRKAFGADAATTAVLAAKKLGEALFPQSAEAASPVEEKVAPEEETEEEAEPEKKKPAVKTETKTKKAEVDPKLQGPFLWPEGHHPSKYKDAKDVWSYASALPKKDFKKFVDLNEDDPNFRGFGYITMSDEKDGHKKLQKVISKPDSGQELRDLLQDVIYALTGKRESAVAMRTYNKGVESGGLNPAELKAVADVVGHYGIGQNKKEESLRRDALDRERLAEAKAAREDRTRLTDAAMQDRAEGKRTALVQKNAEALWKRLELQAPVVGTDEAGKPIKAYNIALLDLLDKGVKLPSPEDSPDLYPAAKAEWENREEWVVRQFAKLKEKYNPDDITNKKSATYKHRSALLKIYRNELLKSYAPK